MPLLKITTNRPIDQNRVAELLKHTSESVAAILGKPERYVMISIEHNPQMLFAGSDDALAYLELKSIGLPDDQTKQISNALCQLMEQQLAISPERVYIEFSAAERHQWGWNSSTF
ncbi:MAG: phenylpyruvate tautomerase MIF-related protein [Candidatus Thiodiazotropha sp.]|jgi:phenylpyruvate tautomerase PptA (4-oxalocrotonate tautomerase family)